MLAPGLLWTELSQTHIDQYHRLLPLTTVAWALAVDLAGLSLLAMVVVRVLERLSSASETGPGRMNRRGAGALLWALWFGLLAARAVAGADRFAGAVVAADHDRARISGGGGAAADSVAGVAAWYGLAVRATRFGSLLVGFCIFWMIPVLVAAGFAHQPWDQAEFQEAAAGGDGAAPAGDVAAVR